LERSSCNHFFKKKGFYFRTTSPIYAPIRHLRLNSTKIAYGSTRVILKTEIPGSKSFSVYLTIGIWVLYIELGYKRLGWTVISCGKNKNSMLNPYPMDSVLSSKFSFSSLNGLARPNIFGISRDSCNFLQRKN